MKKFALLLATAIAFQFAKAQDESFHKHALVISVGSGIDGYTILEKYTFNGVTFTGPSFGAVCASYPIGLEYGIGKRWGLGLIGKIDNYILKKDSISGFQPTAVGFEFGLVVNFHFIRTHHIDFFAGLNLGSSNFTWTVDNYSDQLYGAGGWGDIHGTLRYYFGRFGLFASLSFPTMNYSKLTTNNATLSNVLQYVPASWEAKGAAFNFGVQFRFFSPPSI